MPVTTGYYSGENSDEFGRYKEPALEEKSRGEQDGMSDGGASSLLKGKSLTPDQITNLSSYETNFQSILHSNNIFRRDELDLLNKTYRFGYFNPYGAVTTTKEFIFFTKPDLHIFERDPVSGALTGNLNSGLMNIPFWVDMAVNRKRIIELLQASYGHNMADPFNHLLQNTVISNLEVPNLQAETIETPNNMHGVGFSYRGSSEASDDKFSFSLEFKDFRYLDVYYFFKAYEEYETLKHHGTITPWRKYIENKIVHDQFAIYKFLVDEDMETILYYAKYYGVMPKSLPRDVFSNSSFDNGITYPIEFEAAFFDDMKPDIIADFNALSIDYFNQQPYDIDIYNNVFGRIDNRAAKSAYVIHQADPNSPSGYSYKLKWRGSDQL